MKKKLLILLPLAIGLAAIAAAPLLKTKPAQEEPKERAQKVRAFKATPLAVVPRAVGYGTVKPARTWDAVAEVAGQVVWKAPALKGGQAVAAGTPMLRIEDADYRLALARIEAGLSSSEVKDKTTRASLAIARKDLKLLRDDLDRKKTLAAKGAASRTAVDAAERQLLNAETQVQNLENALLLNAAERQALAAEKAQAELNLNRTAIAAPFPVRITEVKIGEAQYANKGQLLFIADGLDVAEIEAQFPIGILRPLIAAASGSGEVPAVAVTGLEAKVRLRAATHMAEWSARIDRAAGSIDPETQSLGVVVAIDDPAGQAMPGKRPPLLRNTFVEVELIAPEMADQLAVPLSAIHAGKIYVVGTDSRLEIRDVDVAFSQRGFAVLRGGIGAGEMIVTSDLSSAVPGMLLEAQEDRKSKRRMVEAATGKAPSPEKDR
jgi:RND family efflux transporter MFP subunit